MPFSANTKSKALVACGRRCCICQKYCGTRVECHHIVPEEQGGSDSIENCIPLCFDCHAEVQHYNPRHPKGNKFTFEELRGHRDNLHRKLKELKTEVVEQAFLLTGEESANPKSKSPHPSSDEPEVQILVCIAAGSERAEDIEKQTKLSSQKTIYYLLELRRKGLIDMRMRPWQHTIWFLKHDGRRFLIENDLIA